MKYPAGTLIRNTRPARVNHWITATCFVLLMVSGLAMFHPMLFWLSGLFGGGQWARAVHPWIGIVLAVSYAGLIVQFWRDTTSTQKLGAITLARMISISSSGMPLQISMKRWNSRSVSPP